MDKYIGRGSAKFYFLKYLQEKGILKKDSRIIDMGSGTSAAWDDFFRENPNAHYTGIEPFKKSCEKAKQNFGHLPNVKLYNEFAYNDIKGFGDFDICISLSVLEHIKQLDLMLEKSVQSVKPGGKIIHWYDLGHALYSSSFKELVHVFVGNHLPFLLSEYNFVRYLDPDYVEGKLMEFGIKDVVTANYQSRSLKSCLKKARTEDDYKKIGILSRWEFDNQDIVQRISKKGREKLYPSVVVSGTKI
jgi:SAM-dependent methyltransferase